MFSITVVMLLAQPIGATQVAKVSPTRTGAAVAAVAPAGKARTSCASGTNPEFVAYDPVTHWFYVTDSGGGNISVYKSTCTLAGTIHLPGASQPRGVAYSPSTNRIYVVDENLAQVYVISKLTIKQTLTSPAFSYPFAIVYDPSDGYFGGGGSMVITNSGNDTITAISQATPSGTAIVIATVAVGGAPQGIAYDPVYDALLVANSASDNVTSLSASFLTKLSPGFAVGSYPVTIAFDPANLFAYVTNEASDNVSVITPYGTYTTIAVGSYPFGAAYNPATQTMWVANFVSHNISVIGTTTVIGHKGLAVGTQPVGLAFDENDNQMIVAVFNTATVDVL